MPPSLETSNSTYPSLISETSSIASSELPRTASENFNHSPFPWRAPSVTTTTTNKDKDQSERSLPPRFAKRLLRLVGPSQHNHSQSLSSPTNVVELSAYNQQQHQHQEAEIENERTTAPRKHRTREEASPFRFMPEQLLTRASQHAASWGRTSLASAASTTPLASKHSSLGPLPIFPRPPIHTISRHSRTLQSSSLDQDQDHHLDQDHASLLGSDAPLAEEDRQAERPLPPPPTATTITPRTITPNRTKSRPTLASLFQSAGRKALRRDDFRKDSYQKEPEEEVPVVVSQSVPSTPLRRRFLGLMSNASDTIRSAKSTPHPPPPPPLPHISLPTTFKGKEKENSTTALPPTPILRRKRSSLPIPPRPGHEHHEHTHQDYDSSAGHQQYQQYQHQHPPMPMPMSQPSHDYLDPNLYTLRRSKSDSKHGKRSHSPGQTTSIRVPGAPPQHHPHPHPFFPCDGPLDRGLLYIPSFDFEPPVTRPSTPGQSVEYLPMEHHRRKNKGRHGLDANDVDSQMSAEIKSVLAAGTEARRERRAPSRERLRVIGPMHRQNLPDVTGGDDQLSPDPRFPSQPVPIPIPSSRSKTHVAHGLFAFESPAVTPYGSRIDLPPTPPPSKPRKLTPSNPMPTTVVAPQLPFGQQGQGQGQLGQQQQRTHHRHFSSSATAVAVASPPMPPPKDAEMGFKKGFTSPRLFAGNKPAAHQDRKLGSSSSSYDKHQYQHSRGQSLNQLMTPMGTGTGMGMGRQYRQDSVDSHVSREGVISPSSSYRHKQHLHSHSLSGSTVQNHYPTPVQSPMAGLGISLYPPTREERYYDLREAMKLSIGDSRYKSFERAVRRYNEHVIPMHGQGGLLERVQRLLNEAVDDGLPSQTARRYLQTFQAILVEA